MPEPEPTIGEQLAGIQEENDNVVLDDISEIRVPINHYDGALRSAMRNVEAALTSATETQREVIDRLTTYDNQGDAIGTQPNDDSSPRARRSNTRTDAEVFTSEIINRNINADIRTEGTTNTDESVEVSDDSVQPETLPNCSCRSCTEAPARPATPGNSIPTGTRRDDRRTTAARRLP